MKQKLKTIGDFLSIIFLGLMAFYLAVEVFVPSMTLTIFGFKPYRVITTSMEPFINRGDLVIDTRFDIEQLEQGMIVTFYADVDYNGVKDIVTHYVHSVTGNATDGYIIRTIRANGTTQDPWILSEDDIIGLYLFHIPLVGSLMEFLQSPFGIAIVVIDAVALIAIIMLLSDKSKKPESKG
jgi:signal peptidase